MHSCHWLSWNAQTAESVSESRVFGTNGSRRTSVIPSLRTQASQSYGRAVPVSTSRRHPLNRFDFDGTETEAPFRHVEV
ncbi:hypothetical protein HSB1_08610 [Halogranum salarium B-1]|uniref:Uncharacterized protein n=1 Tax=Halogranum salarium B-1 TaxID=1210908 RepID=J3A495_9EURY|nr:hypothetical protein HSB1_08610 [Halogranum salarium B-1]